jgi:hypothetical protein
LVQALSPAPGGPVELKPLLQVRGLRELRLLALQQAELLEPPVSPQPGPLEEAQPLLLPAGQAWAVAAGQLLRQAALQSPAPLAVYWRLLALAVVRRYLPVGEEVAQSGAALEDLRAGQAKLPQVQAAGLLPRLWELRVQLRAQQKKKEEEQRPQRQGGMAAQT